MLAPGTTIGRYQILGPLGHGGMASVYKAFQPSLEREVALKLVRRGVAEDTELVARFTREARAIARLRHPNIVQVFDFEVGPSGELVLAMELLDGGTLKQRMIQLAALGSRIERSEIVRIVWEVADALTFAHRAGVIHRDVKPSNVMLTQPRDRAVVTDFGIARVLGETAHTQTGVGVGTPEYMAPEQAQGASVDHRADIYSLGVLAYELFVGRVPYRADTPLAVALAHIRDPLPLPSTADPSIGPGVERALLKALAKDPTSRFDDALAFGDALRSGLSEDTAGGPTVFGGRATPATAARQVRPDRWALLTLGGAASLLIALAAVASSGLLAVPGASPTSRPNVAAVEPSPTPAPAAPSPLATATASPRSPKFPTPAKGALIWEARLDGSDEFTLSAGGPQPNLPTVRTPVGSVEVSITRPNTSGGLVPRGISLPDQDRYVAEMDLALERADMTVMWLLRRPSSFTLGMGLVVASAGGVGAYRFHPDFQALGPDVPITGLASGRTVTIAVAAMHSRYEVFVDGARVLEFTSDTSGTSTPMIGVEGNAGVVRITRFQYYRAP